MAEPELETWQNSTKGRIGVLKFDHRGDLRNELVRSGMNVHLTQAERQINQEKAASAELDVFSNGHLTPVRLLEGTEDAKEIASNPNLMGESDLRGLFKAHWKTFDTKVKEITNTITLNRLLALSDDDSVNATVKQVATIRKQIESLTQSSDAPEDTTGARVGVKDDLTRELGNFAASTPR